MPSARTAQPRSKSLVVMLVVVVLMLVLTPVARVRAACSDCTISAGGTVESCEAAAGKAIIDLDDCGITALSPGAFDYPGLAGAMQVWLSNNAIARLPRDAFAGLASANTLLLRDNRIAVVEAGAFSGLPLLSVLDLHATH